MAGIISMTKPADDAIFQMKLILNSRDISTQKVERVRAILIEYDRVIAERAEKGVTGLQRFPRGNEEE